MSHEDLLQEACTKLLSGERDGIEVSPPSLRLRLS